MDLKSIRGLLHTNLHFIWVILFFILHGYSQFYHLIPIKDLLFLSVELFIGGLLLFWLSNRIFGDKKKSGVFTSFILIVFLFFGVIQDFFAGIRFLSVLSYLRLLIIIFLFATVIVFVILKKTKSDFKKGTVYINSLFLVYLLIDIFTIFFLSIFPSPVTGKSSYQFKSSGCDSCRMPSVYLIVMDEYFGSKGLKEYFKYDNTSFENFLHSQGFKVTQKTTSNYQLTLFSMASMLNMGYIPNLKEEEMGDHYVYNKILSLLKNNVVCDFFHSNRYRIINLSNFELKYAPAESLSTDLPQKIQLITNQTMVHRILKYLPVWFAQMKIIKYQKKQEGAIANTNEEILNKTLLESRNKNELPAFVYVHLMMPHLPYLYDSVGNKKFSFERNSFSRNEKDRSYLEYLVYTNHRISKFISDLQLSTNNDAIILLMSDHGYRDAAYKEVRFAYQTLNAVFLPDKNYAGWYDGMSNVNQFRVLFNSVFGQNLPLLQDSIVQYPNGR